MAILNSIGAQQFSCEALIWTAQVDSYLVNLSAIGATNQICKAFFCKFVENTRKKTVFSRLSGTKRNFFADRVGIFITGTIFTNKWATIWRF